MAEETLYGRWKDRAKSAGTWAWTRIKNRNAKEKLETAVKAIVATTIAGGLAVGAVGYVRATDAADKIKNNESAWLQDLHDTQLASEAANQASDAAVKDSEQAKSDAAVASSNAAAAKDEATKADANAVTAQNAANDAVANANAAKDIATQTKATADKAKADAATAQATADKAHADLQALQSNAEATAEQIAAAQATANTAQAAASNAAADAENAQATADKAAADIVTAKAAADNALAVAQQALANAATAKAAADQAQSTADQALGIANAATSRLPVFRSVVATEGQNATLTAPTGVAHPFAGPVNFDGTSKYVFSYSWLRSGFATSCTGGVGLLDGTLKSVDVQGKPYPIITPGTPIDDYTSYNYVTRAAIVTPPAGAHQLYFQINPGGTCKYSDIVITITKVG